MEYEITVTAHADGWRLQRTDSDEEKYFRSGADAEAAAHELGVRIAETGVTAVIDIYLRDGALGGHFVHAPQQLGPRRSPPRDQRFADNA